MTSRPSFVIVPVYALSLAAVLLIIGVILLLLGYNPIETLQKFIEGAFSTDNRRADVIMTAVPLLLCASGLLLTQTAGLWNIGIEGQIIIGAIFASFIALNVTDTEPNPIIIGIEIVAAAFGGMLWAGLTAFLRTRAKVNEIFGGVALNFIAANFLIYLVSGPWQGAGNTPKTEPFAAGALLPRLGELRLSIPAIVLAILAYGIVFFILSRTRFGLQLRALGKSEKGAFLLGVRTERTMTLAMLMCGALAGIAGAVQVLFLRGRLETGISGGIGFLSVLIVLLVSVRAVWIPLVALFFAVVPIGSGRLAVSVGLDSSLGNVFQSALVLAVLLANGIRGKLTKK
jgi:general nucleoside transport system permease protein